jgi:hypothetical protein
MSEIAQKPMSSIAKGSVLMVGKPVFAQATELSTKEILNEVRKLGNQKDFLSFDHVSMHVTAWDMLQNFIVDYIENTLEAEVPAFLKNRSVEDNFVRLTFDEVVFINEFLDENEIETEVGSETGGGSDEPLKYKVIFDQQTVDLTSGLLVIGKKYMAFMETGDDFSNVGYVEDGVEFIATQTTPTVWANNTYVINITDSQPVVVNEIHNDFSDISLKYDGALTQIIISSSLNPFDKNKTFVQVPSPLSYVISDDSLKNIEISSSNLSYRFSTLLIEFYP